MRTKELFTFIKERHAIYRRRQLGLVKPWTEDPILQRYRFCNVYRELDTQTIWFAEHWRKRYARHEDLWFASLIFRFINWHPTAGLIWRPIPWTREMFLDAIAEREAAKEKVYSGAYMISTHGVKEKKSTYLANSLDKIWAAREYIRYREGESLEAFHRRLMEQFDVGSFLAAQVIADCKHTGEMRKAPDWFTFAASGPGSRRGLNRVFLQPVKQPIKEPQWKFHFELLHLEITTLQRNNNHILPPIDGQDLQNCLCEFDKYERVRLGEGVPKSKYKGV